MTMQLEPNEIHIWSTDLVVSEELEKERSLLLSPDEIERANRFHFPIHRKRFTVARAHLRKILGLYLHTPPKEIVFSYNAYRKPYLDKPRSKLQFNLAHSNDLSVYAITQEYETGIDIEKMQDHYNQAVAKRYFDTDEYGHLMQLPKERQTTAFYRLWARKEALVKAIGKGLRIPLSSFSTFSYNEIETIMFENRQWSLMSIAIHPDYQAAIATNQPIKKISFWNFFEDNPRLDRVSLF